MAEVINSHIERTKLMFGVSLHKLLIHFPIALAIVASGFDLWAVTSRELRFHAVGSALIKLAALAAVVSAVTGLDLAGVSGLGSTSAVTGHAGLAILSTLLLVGIAMIRYSAEVRSDGSGSGLSPFLMTTEVLAAFLIAATAVFGHKI